MTAPQSAAEQDRPANQQPASSTKAAPQDDPEELFVRAIEALEACNSISATIVHEVYLYEKHLVGSGVYLARRRGDDYLLRLELKIQVGQETSSLVQVCDGQYLWTRHRMPADDRLKRIDVAKAKAGLQEAKLGAGQPQQALLPGLGGLPAMLRGIHQAFQFDSAVLGTWGAAKQPVWRIQGHWRRGALARLFPEKAEALRAREPIELGPLPPHLPEKVVVFLLVEQNLFPFRIEYSRLAVPQPSDGAAEQPVMTIELSNIDINLPIAEERFLYNPGDMQAVDVTADFLRSLTIPWR